MTGLLTALQWSLALLSPASWQVEIPDGPLDRGLDTDQKAAIVVPLTPDQQVLVYTAWDGGPRLDLRMSKLLETEGFRGTFFIDPKSDILLHLKKILARNMEIGSLGASHGAAMQRFSLLSPEQVDYELRSSKADLEVLTEQPVVSFAYPFRDTGMRSWMRREIAERVIHAGYWGARVDSNEAVGAYVARSDSQAKIEVPGIHYAYEPFFVQALKGVLEKGQGYAVGMWGHAWEWDHPNPGAEEFDWGRFAGWLRHWASTPGVVPVTFREVVARRALCGAMKVEAIGTSGGRLRATVSAAEPLPAGAAGPASVLFVGVHAQEGWVDGQPAKTIDTPSGTRVALPLPEEAKRPPVRHEAAPKSWNLEVETSAERDRITGRDAGATSGLPGSAKLSLVNDEAAAGTFTAALDVPFGWSAEPAEASVNLKARAKASLDFSLSPPKNPGAKVALFLARVRCEFPDRPPLVRLVRCELPIEPTKKEAAHILRRALDVEFKADPPGDQPEEAATPPVAQPAAATSAPPPWDPAALEQSREHPDGSRFYRDDYVDMRPYAQKEKVFGRAILRARVEIPTPRRLRLDAMSTANCRIWWDGELVSTLDHLKEPRLNVEALPDLVDWKRIGGAHELQVEFITGRNDKRDESGFFLFFLDEHRRPYTDIVFRKP